MPATTVSSSEAEASVQEKPTSYARTEKGLVLIAEMVLSLVVLICYATSQSATYFWLPLIALIFSAFFFGLFAMVITDLDQQSRWLYTKDFARAVVKSVMYLITSLILVARYRRVDRAAIAGAAFGLVACLVYAYDTYIIFLQLKSYYIQRKAADDEAVLVA